MPRTANNSKQTSLLSKLKRNPSFNDEWFSINTLFSGGEKFIVITEHHTSKTISIPVEYAEVIKPIIDIEVKELKLVIEEEIEKKVEEEAKKKPTQEDLVKAALEKTPQQILAELEDKQKTSKKEKAEITE
jgi:hypothetical protein